MTDKLLPPSPETEVSRLKQRVTILERRLTKRIAEIERSAFTLDAVVVERTTTTTISSGSGIVPFQQVTRTGDSDWGRWSESDPTDVEITEDGIYLLTAAMSLNVGGSATPSHNLVIQDPGGNPFAQIGPLKHSGVASPHDMHLDTQIVTPIEASTTIRLRWLYSGGAGSYPSGITPHPIMGIVRIREGIE